MILRMLLQGWSSAGIGEPVKKEAEGTKLRSAFGGTDCA